MNENPRHDRDNREPSSSSLKKRLRTLSFLLDDGEEERPTWVAAWIILGLALVLMVFLWKPWIHGNDGVRNYVYCRSLWIDGDLDFANEFDHYRTVGELQIPASPDRVTGRQGNAVGIGSGLFWSPFFLAAHLVSKVVGGSADGYSALYAWAISFGSTFYAIVGLVLLTRVLSWRFDSRSALIGLIGVWLGSPLVFYMYMHPSMSHAVSFFLCSLIVWEYERWRHHTAAWHFVVIGITTGLAVATRFDNAVYVLLLAAFWARSRLAPLLAQTHRRGSIRSAALSIVLIIVGFLIGFWPQMAAWRAMYGSYLAGPRDYELGRTLSLWDSPNLGSVLISGHRGLFVWSPVLLLALIGLVRLAALGRRLADSMLVAAFAVQVWVIGGWGMWWGGASFGQRFFIDLVPAFALGLTCIARDVRFKPNRRIFMTAIALCLLWSAGLAVQYVGGIVDRERPVRFVELARNQFTAVPVWIVRHAAVIFPGLHHESPTLPQEPRG